MTTVRSRKYLPFNPDDNRVFDAPEFPQQAIPSVVKMLIRRTYDTAFERPHTEAGIDMIARCIVSIYSGSLNKTAESVDRVYRLLDTSFNGASWSLVDGKPQPVPLLPSSSGYEDSTRGLLQRILEQLQESGSGELDDDILAQLVQIGALLA